MVLSGDEIYRKSNGDIGAVANIDAVHVLDQDRFLFSTFAAELIGANQLRVRDGDLVIYNKATDQASLYLSETVFRTHSGEQGATVDIDAFSMTPP